MGRLVVGLLGLALLAPLGARAQTQIKPRFMILFDTSGSMAVDLDDIPTYGDGITGPTRGLDTDCDGLANDSRIFVAKEALRNMIYAFGDIEFGLTAFPRFASSQVACSYSRGGAGPFAITHRIQDNECNLTFGPFVGGIGDPTQNTGAQLTLGNCGANWDGMPGNEIPTSLIPAACRPGSGGNPPARFWSTGGAGSPQFCTNYLGGCPGQNNGVYIYPDGDVLVGFEGFGWPATDNRNGIIKWIDNTEPSFNTSTTSGNFCNHSGAGNCELRPQGPTPLGGTLRAARDYMIPIRSGDSVGSCRPYTVLLLTDGVETCEASTTPVTVAGQLAAAGIPVYVVGLAITPGGRTLLNQIATAGGTDAGAPGGDTAFFADDAVTLSTGLSEIVADSLLVEVCNDADDDCDTLVDEGFVKYCNRPGGVTMPTLCMDPGETVCNGVDDNCDGRIDEGLLNACGACGPVPPEVCDGLDNNCNGVIDEGGVCMMCIPEAEICDNDDNDCDGMIDENLTRACGIDVGECSAGTQTCTAGVWGACSNVGPSPEMCNGLDDDCDGLVDNLTMRCGSDVGECVSGIRRCVSGSFGMCEGNIGPEPEVCDGLDNDCDGRTDEGVAGLGMPCGPSMGECVPGMTACIGGMVVCDGGTGPTMEGCNGLDDDCDGVPDDGIFVGTPCGTDVGECSPGFNECVDGMVECRDAIGPSAEVCDGLDNDCDADVDEGLGLGEPCGSDEGLCLPGRLQCVDGTPTCVDEVPPMAETCDCEDNDCDGEIDEDPALGSLCPEGSTCVECQCALPCVDTEFGPSCPTMRAPRMVGDECYCVREACNPDTCATETIERAGEELCAPDSDDVTNCVCKNNECTFACEGVVCPEGTTCNPRDPSGRCAEDTCRGLGCGSGEICNVISGECEPDPCLTADCEPDEACRLGVCEPSCATVECPAGERCAAGVCVDDPCAGVTCPSGQVCDPASATCVDGMCVDVRCPGGSNCDPLTGECVRNPCATLTCPAGQECVEGECAIVDSPDAGVDAGVDDPNRVLAAGGGGCACDAAGAGGGSNAPGWLALLFLGAVLLWRRRASRRWLPVVGMLALGQLVTGCDVEPFCLDCPDATGVGDGAIDARGDARIDAARDAAIDAFDANIDAACMEGAPERCNDLDDDCDEIVDEDVDTSSDPNNCGACGSVCAPPGAFPECVDGECRLGACDVGFIDLDGDPDNGCEYRCLPTGVDDSVCDLRDNDCDGTVDEDVAIDTDPMNCGACGRACRFARGAALCVGGTCELGACDPNFYDIDGVDGNGCEYACVRAMPATERCNARDDDCDGMIDEGNPDGGTACGSDVGACARGNEMCIDGSLQCTGETGPGIETCNTVDDDCDGSTDETTNFMSDPNNCGGCGIRCSEPNAVVRCQSGSCVRVACSPGFVDVDPGIPGCEYMCDPRGAEVCNGVDDDCDTDTDEGLTPPSNFCNPNGLCAGTTPTCTGAMGWACNYTHPSYQEVETLCDGLDNDCDGPADEPFPTLGNACSNGLGECQRNGTIRCTADELAVECSASMAGMPTPETCDGQDDDCDGFTDEGIDPAGAGTGVTTVLIDGGVRIMAYEASRPDATAGAAGVLSTAACSRDNRIPWTTVTWNEARAACCALNTGGACTGSTGWRLCDAADWENACNSPSDTCTWAYNTACSTSSTMRCNGAEWDCPGPGRDCVQPTGSFAACRADWGATDVWDMSGNVKEWTNTAVAPGVYQLRGGSYNNIEAGRTCDFDFTVSAQDFAFPNTGFRGCWYP